MLVEGSVGAFAVCKISVRRRVVQASLIIVHDVGIDFLLYAIEEVVHVETITSSSLIPRLPLCSCAAVVTLLCRRLYCRCVYCRYDSVLPMSTRTPMLPM
jgi:hypothetical protein